MTMHEDDRSVRMSTARGTAQSVERDADLIMAPAGWRLSWGAVLAGIIVALAAHIVLNLFGLGVGIAGAPIGTSVEWFGAGFATWWAIAGIIAAGIGGWVAGRTLGSGDRNDGMIHGLLSWAGTTLVIAFLLASALGGAIGMQDKEQLQAMYGQHVAPQTGAGGGPAPSGASSTAPSTQGSPLQRAQSAISGGAIASFIALLLGAWAAAAAGRAGVSSARRALHNA